MDRIPSDHDSVDVIRATLARHGGQRVRVEVPQYHADRFPRGDVFRVVVGGSRRYARIEPHLTADTLLITGAYDGPITTRDRSEAPDRLTEWVNATGLGPGDPVLIDVVTEDYLYGIRHPGDRVFYDDPEPPDDDLVAIARKLASDE